MKARNESRDTYSRLIHVAEQNRAAACDRLRELSEEDRECFDEIVVALAGGERPRNIQAEIITGMARLSMVALSFAYLDSFLIDHPEITDDSP